MHTECHPSRAVPEFDYPLPRARRVCAGAYFEDGEVSVVDHSRFNAEDKLEAD
jgi:hypothetical protein